MSEDGSKGKRKAAAGFELSCFYSRSDDTGEFLTLFWAELRQVLGFA